MVLSGPAIVTPALDLVFVYSDHFTTHRKRSKSNKDGRIEVHFFGLRKF